MRPQAVIRSVARPGLRLTRRETCQLAQGGSTAIGAPALPAATGAPASGSPAAPVQPCGSAGAETLALNRGVVER